MSLAALRKITEYGVISRSHIEGKKYQLTPAYSITIQNKLKSIMNMAFDERIAYPATYNDTKQSTELSMRWALRSRNYYSKRDGNGIFGIVQGGTY